MRPKCRGRDEGPDRRTCRYGPLARREIHRATRGVGSWSRKCSPEEASPSVRPWSLRNRLVAGEPWTADTGCRSEDRSRRGARPSQRYGKSAASKRLACRVGLHGIRPVLFLRSLPKRNGAIRHRPPPLSVPRFGAESPAGYPRTQAILAVGPRPVCVNMVDFGGELAARALQIEGSWPARSEPLVESEAQLQGLKGTLEKIASRSIEVVQTPSVEGTPLPGTDPKGRVHLLSAVEQGSGYLVTLGPEGLSGELRRSRYRRTRDVGRMHPGADQGPCVDPCGPYARPARDGRANGH
jgi:hypothetical protein